MEEDRGAQKPLELAIKRIVSARTSAKSIDNNGGNTLLRLFLASSVSGAIHYGWGLQISIFTPYAQLLGVPHMFASLICSSGPLAGILVNPMLNHYSDRCTMRMGRRRPFILVGCLLICISHRPWSLVSHQTLGTTLETAKENAVGRKHGPQIGYNIFSLWGSLGVILGCAAGATAKWPEWFPWLKTKACCGVCVNIKGAFFTSMVLIVVSMALTMAFTDEKAIEPKDVVTYTVHSFSNPFNCLKNMPSSTNRLFILMGVSWLALYPFFVYNTDWMGREIYHGNPRGSMEELQMYNNGFRKGCIGMIFCVIVRTVTTAFIPKLCQKLTPKVVWSLSNFLLFLLMLAAVIISILSMEGHRAHSSDSIVQPDPTLKAIALGIFALMGISAAITQCLPMALAFQIAAAEGRDIQGHTIGAITIAVVVPQLITVLTTGPIDNAAGGGGNTPGFVFSALSFLSWFLGLMLLS